MSCRLWGDGGVGWELGKRAWQINEGKPPSSPFHCFCLPRQFLFVMTWAETSRGLLDELISKKVKLSIGIWDQMIKKRKKEI